MELFEKKDEGIKKNIGREGGVTDMDKMCSQLMSQSDCGSAW